jgi:hypothetical protein
MSPYFPIFRFLKIQIGNRLFPNCRHHLVGRVVPNAPHAPPHPLSTICRRPPSPDGRIACVRPVAQNENSLLSLLMRQRMNENTVWTYSQDYGAD